MKKKIILYWVLAIVITLAAVVFQRMTGPTNPQRLKFAIDDTEYETKLPRSLTIDGGYSTLKFTVKNLPDSVTSEILFRSHKSPEGYAESALVRSGDTFTAQLPSGKPVEKIEYYVRFTKVAGDVVQTSTSAVVARFKNDVPAALLIPHILLMFVAMLLSNLTGLIAAFRRTGFMTYAKIMWVCLFLGGIVFGCLVQKAAFGVYWTGFPVGNDLTDNKTLFSLVLWTIAIVANGRNTPKWWWIVIASLFLLAIYCIPHSL